MKKLTIFLFQFSLSILAQNAWINEFHYDNTGSPDIGEFVEVAIEDTSSYDLSDFRISFYSSISGTRYGVYHDLKTFIPGSTDNNITLFSKFIPGIQNGPNDGIALDYQGTVLHFISYEGILTATDGVAMGTNSVDVGVSESNLTPVGYSIGLNGSGTNFSDFNWTILSDDSPGEINTDQALPVELTTFSVSFENGEVKLYWVTSTEINNYGFEIERLYQSSTIMNHEWEMLGFVSGHGNSNSPKYYAFTDDQILPSGKYSYRLKQIDVNGEFNYSAIIENEIKKPGEFKLYQNYPNPFNPSTTISFNIPELRHTELSVYNILGEKVNELINGNYSAGYYKVNFNSINLTSGIYFYQLISGSYSQIRRMHIIR